jgi:hypothetical protein
MGLSKELLKKLAEANPSGGGNYVQHGRFVFMVDAFLLKTEGFKGISVITELLVADSAPATDGKQSEAPHNPRGSKCSVVFNLTGGNQKAAEAARGNLKALVIGLLGKDSYEAMMANEKLGADSGDRYDKVLDLLQANARGAMIADETHLGKIQTGQNAGKSIVNHKWGYLDTTDEQRLKNIAVLDGKAKLDDAWPSRFVAQAAQAAATA